MAAWLARLRPGNRALQNRDTLLSPDEALVWIHCSKSAAIPAFAVAEALLARDPDLPVLLTHRDGDTDPTINPDVLTLDGVLDGIAITHKFLRDWHPTVALIFADVAEPDLVLQISQSGAQVHLYCPITGEGTLGFPRSNRLVLRALLRQVTSVFTPAESQAQRLHSAGLPADASHVSGALPTRQSPEPLDNSATQDIASQLAGRPTWFATNVSPAEEDILLDAYETTAHKAHRSLMIVELADQQSSAAFRDKAQKQGRHAVLWSRTAAILPETQIVIVDQPDETALWYRVAPLTFIGQTLNGDGAQNDPFLPAGLGSAILHGPNLGDQHDAFQELDRAGAARVVRDLPHLSRVLVELLAADKLAEMAHAAWDLSTQSAEAADTVAQALLSDTTEPKAD